MRISSHYIIFFSLFFSFFTTHAQNKSAPPDSTSKTLDEVIVRGFETRKTNLKTPASVSAIRLSEIERFQNTNPLPLFNAEAGIRLEERSPNSYRLSVRGSSIRSPFGVRNVKVYWNGIPVTDANGSTYFNLLDFNNLGSIELLKGPSSSIFGAGYGGVAGLNSRIARPGSSLEASTQYGSYNTLSTNAFYGVNNNKTNATFSATYQSSDGYRVHSAIDNFKLSSNISTLLSDKHKLSFAGFFSTTDYQTPGGLTLEQAANDRTSARISTPAPIDQKAGIIQKLGLAGITHHWNLNTLTDLTTTIFYYRSALENPFLTSYEYRDEDDYGYRLLLRRDLGKLDLFLGSEGIFTDSEFDVKGNNGGTPTGHLYFTEINSSSLSHFIQIDYMISPIGLELTAGMSYNSQQYINHTIVGQSESEIKENPSVPWIPRIALLKSFSPKTSVFYTWSGGYSSPTAPEMTANFENLRSSHLSAEKGISHEIGFKSYWSEKFKTEISVYNQTVKNALVRNIMENGGEFFENSGKVIQNGLEWSNHFNSGKINGFIEQIDLDFNAVFNDYRFGKYFNEGAELKGKVLPGTSKTNLYFKAGFITQNHIFLNADFNYLSKTPLNSQNTVFADETLLSNLQIGMENLNLKNFNFKVYGGINNLLNNKYSLGYDYNAFGGRFYNPSPTRHFNLGIKIVFI